MDYNEQKSEMQKQQNKDYNNFLPLVLVGVPLVGGYGLYKVGKHKGYKQAQEEKCPVIQETKNPPLAVGLVLGVVLTVGVYYGIKFGKKLMPK